LNNREVLLPDDLASGEHKGEQSMQLHFRTLCWVFSLTFLLGCATTGQHPSSRQAGAQSHTRVLSSTSRSTPDFRQFAGTWIAHGAILTISSDGTAIFSARTYRWCSVGVPHPCDTMDAQGHIENGNQEQARLTYVSGPVASGTILTSTFHPIGLPVTLTLEPNDTIRYAAHTLIALLCGPAAPVGACGA
jgi:hypothetical protein